MVSITCVFAAATCLAGLNCSIPISRFVAMTRSQPCSKGYPSVRPHKQAPQQTQQRSAGIHCCSIMLGPMQQRMQVLVQQDEHKHSSVHALPSLFCHRHAQNMRAGGSPQHAASKTTSSSSSAVQQQTPRKGQHCCSGVSRLLSPCKL
jgi:hypothetical protein